jgi:hypothetical protein
MNQYFVRESSRHAGINRCASYLGGPFLVWGILPALVAIAILWYPFGFAMGAMLEDWGYYDLFNRIPAYWNSFPGSPLAELSAARPFQFTPFVLAKLIAPDSFVGAHLLLMTACVLKVVASTWIGYFAFRDRRIAITLGLLVLVYPADTQQMSLRTMNISFAQGLMLSGLATCIGAALVTGTPRRLLLTGSSMVACILACLIYEAFLPFYVVPLLLVWGRYGMRMTWRLVVRRRRTIAVWCIAPIFNAAYLFYSLVAFKASYQNSLVHGGVLHGLWVNRRYLWTAGAYRVFFDSWRESIHILLQDTLRYGYIALIFIMVGCSALLLRQPRIRSFKGGYVRLALVGIGAAAVGYLPFMVDESHTNITQRTFMGVSFGATLFLVALLAGVLRKYKMLLLAALTAMVTLGFIQNLYQFDSYTRDYVSKIRPYTSYITDNADWDKPYHLIMDKSGLGGYLTGAYLSTVAVGPRVRAHRTDGTFLLCEDEPPSGYVPFFQCKHTGNQWTVTMGGDVRTFDDKDTQVIHVYPDVTSYVSRGRDWQDFGMLSQDDPVFKTGASDPTRYICRADSMWGYSAFCQGEGWSDGQVGLGNFSHHEWFASVSPDPNLYFSLYPKKGVNYKLVLQVSPFTDPKLRDALRVTVNEQPVTLRPDNQGLSATVPYQYLASGANQMAFHNALSQGQLIGLVLNGVELVPIARVASTPH